MSEAGLWGAELPVDLDRKTQFLRTDRRVRSSAAARGVGPQIVLQFSPPFVTFLSPSWRLPLVVLLLVPLIGRGIVVAPKALRPCVVWGC